MAFIREYAAAGDPFKLRLPKKLRKVFKPPKALRKLTFKKVGKALGSVARVGLQFIPGGSIAEQLLPQQAAASVAPEPAPMVVPEPEVYEAGPLTAPMTYEADEYEEEPAMPELPPWLSYMMAMDPRFAGFARGYGFESGDPAGSGKTSKRKRAAAGPKVKATAKRQVRQKKAAKASAKLTPVRGGKKGKGFDPAILGSILRSGAQVASQFTPSKEFDPSVFGTAARRLSPFGARGGRRSMNPANVKALRRSLRRVEGFEKLVKRIEKQYPRLKRAVGHAPAPAARKGRRCA